MTGTIVLTTAGSWGDPLSATITTAGGVTIAGQAGVTFSGVGDNTPVASALALELIFPIASGTGSPAMPSQHRIYKAYPGLVYNIRASVIGGSYPYTFELANGGSGMTIDANTGEINWPDPQADCTPTVTVTDSVDDTVQGTWTIDVTTSGFKFIDTVNGSSGGTGAIGDPLESLADIKNGLGSVSFGDVLYFRGGTYTLDGTSMNPGYMNIGYDDSSGIGRPLAWLAYPGETATIDLKEYGGTDNVLAEGGAFLRAPYIKMTGPGIYIDGLTLTRDYTKTFELDCSSNARGTVVRNVQFTQGGDGSDGSNAAFLMFTANGDVTSYGTTIQDNDFGSAGHNAIKSYSLTKMLVEDNIFGVNGGVAQKAGVAQYTIRNNRFNASDQGVAGNMNVYGPTTTSGEICYNLFLSASSPVLIGSGKISAIGSTQVYRNTIVGTMELHNVATADGPYTLQNNVMVNANGAETPWAYIIDVSISDSSRVTLTDNLNGAAAAGIVDASGNLQGAYLSYLGTRGWEIP
jgi:hypothetical protein